MWVLTSVQNRAVTLVGRCDPASLDEALHKVNEESARESLTVMGPRRAAVYRDVLGISLREGK